jgi:putative PIN family toxin of toxin-antitoxin system
MAAAKRKVKRFVIDVNCYITFFINRETGWLLKYISKNKIEIFVDDFLIEELSRVLQYPRIKKILPLPVHVYISFVKLISTHIISGQFNVQSPDPDDNYLYDIALSTHAKLLVTGETALLNWAGTPVETISLSSFKKLFG